MRRGHRSWGHRRWGPTAWGRRPCQPQRPDRAVSDANPNHRPAAQGARGRQARRWWPGGAAPARPWANRQPDRTPRTEAKPSGPARGAWPGPGHPPSPLPDGPGRNPQNRARSRHPPPEGCQQGRASGPGLQLQAPCLAPGPIAQPQSPHPASSRLQGRDLPPQARAPQLRRRWQGGTPPLPSRAQGQALRPGSPRDRKTGQGPSASFPTTSAATGPVIPAISYPFFTRIAECSDNATQPQGFRWTSLPSLSRPLPHRIVRPS